MNDGAGNIIFNVGVNNAGLQTGLGASTNLIDKFVVQANAKLNSASATMGRGMNFANSTQFGALQNNLQKTASLTTRLGQHLDSLSGKFASGLGISVAVGGLAGLVGMFTKAITKAREFQTAQMAIAATIQSSYKLVGGVSGRELTGSQGFGAAMGMAEKINQEIIKRQARNILNYQEQLQAYQSSLAPGARKGLNPNQVMDISEQAAIVAKSIGLRGEQIANAARLLMGGGVNVGRSTIGRVLGVTNQDIAGKSGKEFQEYLMSKMKGFEAAQPSFAKGIEGVLSTLESKFDVLFAKVGKGFMDKVGKEIEGLGKILDGPGGEQFAKTLEDLFTGVVTAIKQIATSPAIPVLMKFIKFLAENSDKIVIGAALLALGKVMSSLNGIGGGLIAMFREIGSSSAAASGGVNTLAAATEKLAVAERSATAGGKGVAGRSALAMAYGDASAGMRGAFRGGKFVAPGAVDMGLTARQMKALENTPAGKRGLLASNFMASNARNQMLGWEGTHLAQTAQMQALAEAAGVRGVAGMMGGGKPGLLGKIGGWFTQDAAGWKNAMGVGLPMLGQMGQNALNTWLATQIAGMVLPKSITESGGFNLASNLAIGGATAFPLIKSLMGGIANKGGIMPALGSMGTALKGNVGLGNMTQAGTAIPVIGSAIAGYGIGTAINEELWAGDVAKEQKATAGLAEIRSKHQFAAKIADERQKISEWRAAKAAGGMAGMQNVNYDALIARAEERIKGFQDQETAKVEMEEGQQRVAEMKTQAETAQKKSKLGYGSKAFDYAMEAASKGDKAEIEELLLSGEITDAEASEFRRASGERESDKRKARSLQIKQLKAGLGPDTIASQLEQGLLGVEAQMLDKKELLGAEYESLLKKARNKFVKDFNAPLKTLEAKMSAMSLGFQPLNVLENLEDAQEALKLKLKEMEDVPQSVKDKILAQGTMKNFIDYELAKFDKANQSYGQDDMTYMTTMGRSQMTQKYANIYSLLYGASGKDYSKGAMDFISDAESKRGMLGPQAFMDYTQDMAQKNINQMYIDFQGTQLQRKQNNLSLSNAQLNQQMFDNSLTPWDQQMQSVAQYEARMNIAKERGPGMNYSEMVAAQEQQLRNQMEANQLAVDQAKLAKETLEVMKPEGKLRKDMTEAIAAYTTYLNDVAKNLKENKAAIAVTNKIEIKIDPKLGLTKKDTEIIAAEVKDILCRNARG